MRSLKDVLVENNVPFSEDGKIKLPEHVKRVYIDIGLSFDAPHSQNWIDNDIADDLVVFGFEANPFWVKYITSAVKDTSFKDYHTNTRPLTYDNLYKKFFIVPVAVHNVPEPTVMEFFVPDVSEGCGSLLKPSASFGSIEKQMSVPVYSLKDFFDLLPFDTLDCVGYIKIDVQGCDIDVIKSLGETYLKERVAYLTAEPEAYQYQNSEGNTYAHIHQYMVQNGFMHVHHYNTKDPTFLNPKFQYLSNMYIYQQY